MSKKVKIISHNDLDGHGCPLVLSDFYLSLDPETDFNVEHIGDYSKVDDAVNGFLNWKEAHTYDAFYITDLSMNKAETAEALDKFAADHPHIDIRLIDHHKSALWLNAHEWAIVKVYDENKKMESGTSLCYKYVRDVLAPLHEESESNIDEEGRKRWVYMNHLNAESFADIVTSYDTWAWKNDPDNKHGNMAREFNQLFYLVGAQVFAKRMMMKDLNITMEGHEKLLIEVDNRQRDAYIAKKMNYARLCELPDGNTFVFIYAEREKNDIADAVFDKFQEEKPLFMVLRDHEKLSFRTRGSDFDVSALASNFSGGGHKAAAGGAIQNPDCVHNNRFIEKVVYYYKQLKTEVSK